MVKRTAKPPKLRAKGGETRSVLPFALEVADKMHKAKPCLHTATVLRCVSAMLDVYVLLSLETWKPELASAAC
eukprot:6820110-Alexandrium_andersonii.AAC.1